MSGFGWTCAALTDVGRVRASNEDSVFTNLESGVFVVADGMGGHAAGEVASAIASQTIGATACAACGSIDALGDQLVSAFLAAGDEISRQVEADPTRSGMGTTCTVLMLQGEGHFLIGHIGDSRAYLLRNDVFRRVTRDHSWVQEQVDRGLIEPEQAMGHPHSNIITRALGTDPTPTPDLYSGTVRDGDAFLLASDGLTDLIDDQRIAELLMSAETTEKAAESLIAAANQAGGFDNITVLIVSVEELAP
ncbi:MAG: Stp1/IreP family PP2C-type Ser/Thr phosphatase [Gemmatimonadota bacterium]